MHFGQVEVFRQPFEALISLKRDARQPQTHSRRNLPGLHEPIGVCYAPIDKVIELTLPWRTAAGALAMPE